MTPEEELQLEREQETDPLEDLKDELTTLQSDVVFTAFINVGLRYVSFSEAKDGLQLNYDKTKHWAVFQALSESYDEFAKTANPEDQNNE